MNQHLINHILAGTAHVLRDPQIELVLDRLYYEAQIASDEAKELRRKAGDQPVDVDEHSLLTDFGYSLRPQQGELLYLMARTTRAARVVEFFTSGGAAAIYLATAMRDNGGGLVIGTDWRPERLEMAAKHLDEAGLSQFVEFRLGNPVETLADLGGPIDLVFMDGWPDVRSPSVARAVLGVLEPQLRPGALVLNENSEPDVVEYVRAEHNGYRTSASALGMISVRG